MSFIPDTLQKAKDKLNPKKDDSQTAAKSLTLPITQHEDFCAELVEGTMDFSHLHDKEFVVAVNTGPRNKPMLLASTMRGTFDFFEMLESVGSMWENEQHHAMVYVLTKDFKKSSNFLDEGTIDWIEANWADMIATGIFEAALLNDDSGVVIPAGLITANEEDDE